MLTVAVDTVPRSIRRLRITHCSVSCTLAHAHPVRIRCNPRTMNTHPWHHASDLVPELHPRARRGAGPRGRHTHTDNVSRVASTTPQEEQPQAAKVCPALGSEPRYTVIVDLILSLELIKTSCAFPCAQVCTHVQHIRHDPASPTSRTHGQPCSCVAHGLCQHPCLASTSSTGSLAMPPCRDPQWPQR